MAAAHDSREARRRYISSAGARGSLTDRDYFKSTMSGNADFVVSDPVISKSLNVHIIVVAQALKAPNGSVAAMVAFQVKLSALSLLIEGIKVGEGGYGWMLGPGEWKAPGGEAIMTFCSPVAAAAFRELAHGEAGLGTTIEMHRSDEIGELVRDFNSFVAKLREIVARLKSAQGELESIGAELGGSVGETAAAVSEIARAVGSVRGKADSQSASVGQASSVTEASAAIEEMVGMEAAIGRFKV